MLDLRLNGSFSAAFQADAAGPNCTDAVLSLACLETRKANADGSSTWKGIQRAGRILLQELDQQERGRVNLLRPIESSSEAGRAGISTRGASPRAWTLGPTAASEVIIEKSFSPATSWVIVQSRRCGDVIYLRGRLWFGSPMMVRCGRRVHPKLE